MAPNHRSGDAEYVPALPLNASAKFYDRLLRYSFPEQRVRQAVIKALNIQKGDRVLDVACGSGTLLQLIHAETPGAQLHGIDISKGMLEEASKKLAGLSVRLFLMNATDLGFESASFDKVVSTLAFHHLTNDGKLLALREMQRILRPGGTLVLVDFEKPSGFVTALGFFAVRVADGFANTRASVGETVFYAWRIRVQRYHRDCSHRFNLRDGTNLFRFAHLNFSLAQDLQPLDRQHQPTEASRARTYTRCTQASLCLLGAV